MPDLSAKFCPVIDADGHVIESRVDWVERLGPEFEDVAPRFLNGLHLFTEGKVLPRAVDLLGPTNNPRPRFTKNKKYWTNRPGQHDTTARLADLDEEGIDVAVLFGSYLSLTAMGGIESPRLATALARAYNDWLLDDFCSAAPERLKAVSVLPMQDPAAAVAEVHRAAERGAVSVHTLPHILRTPLHAPQFDPVWAAVQETGLPLCVHIVNSHGSSADLFDTFALKHVFIPTDLMAAVASFVSAGILEKHPDLRVGFFEGGVGWLPWLAARLDSHLKILGDDFPLATAKPSEWMSSPNVSFGAEPDDDFVPLAIETFGADRFMYASDYAHFDCECPYTIQELFEHPTLSDETKRKLAYDNAREFFRLDPIG